ncbi:MAG TPA: hypothetical protein O0X70_01640 [Methanocorpusculum sp.]|nr:hypothetical protein [Methanocorpusculum sp.]
MKYSSICCAVVLAAALVFCAGCATTPGQNPNDPIVGTFYYSNNVPYLGNQGDTLYSLAYVFASDGSGVQNWTATDESRTESFKISWTNLGENRYMVKIINPDGAIYGENLYLNGDILRSETDDKNDGVFIRNIKSTGFIATGDPVVGTYEYSTQVPYIGQTGGDLYYLYYVFDMNGSGLQSWYKAEDGSLTSRFDISWTNLGDNLYMIKIINPDGTIFGENLRLDGDTLRSETYEATIGEFVRVDKVIGK